jgi:hypothetical protein
VTRLRLANWLVPLALGALAATVVVAVLVARSERSSTGLSTAAQEIARANPNVPPEIAALNAQLAQIAALRAGVTYGAGLTNVVRGPVASLRATLGEEWRELGRSVGHARLHPSGTPSRYFQVGAVVVAQHGPARLTLQPSEGQRAVAPVGTGTFEVINFGPLLTPRQGPLDVTLSSEQPQVNATGPSLVLSPLQAEYRQAGQWVTGMPALAQAGPGGLRGLHLASGTTTRFAMTPGVDGRCVVALQGAAVRGRVKVTVTVGREGRSAFLNSRSATANLGPFRHSAPVLTVTVGSMTGSARSSLFVRDIRFVPVKSRG